MKDTIDIKSLFRVLRDKIVWIIVSTVAFALAAYIFSSLFITPTYRANAQLYAVVNMDENVTLPNGQVTQTEIVLRRNVISLYLATLKSNDTMKALSDWLKQSGVEISPAQLRGSLTIVNDSENEPEVIHVSATTSDPELSYEICTAILDMAPDAVRDIYEGCSIAPLEHPDVPSGPSSPNVMRNAMIGALLGLVLSCGIIVVLHLMDTTVQDGVELADAFEIRFLGEIPDMTEKFKGGYQNSYYRRASGSAQAGKKNA